MRLLLVSILRGLAHSVRFACGARGELARLRLASGCTPFAWESFAWCAFCRGASRSLTSFASGCAPFACARLGCVPLAGGWLTSFASRVGRGGARSAAPRIGVYAFCGGWLTPFASRVGLLLVSFSLAHFVRFGVGLWRWKLSRGKLSRGVSVLYGAAGKGGM